MNQFLKYTLTLLTLTVLVGCEKDEPDVVEVDARLELYFDRFAEEGKARGVDVDFTLIEIEGKIEDIAGSNISGQCQTNSALPNTVIIDKAFWDSSVDILREFVIFHELGHCYLDRDHLDDAADDGTCVSIMHSGTGDCTNVYNSSTRDAFLDELFND